MGPCIITCEWRSTNSLPNNGISTTQEEVVRQATQQIHLHQGGIAQMLK